MLDKAVQELLNPDKGLAKEVDVDILHKEGKTGMDYQQILDKVSKYL